MTFWGKPNEPGIQHYVYTFMQYYVDTYIASQLSQDIE